MSESSRLAVDQKLKLEKLRTEFKMLSALLEQHWKKVLLLVVDVLCFMLQEHLITSNQSTPNKLLVSTSSKEPSPYHARPSLITQVSKVSLSLKELTPVAT